MSNIGLVNLPALEKGTMKLWGALVLPHYVDCKNREIKKNYFVLTMQAKHPFSLFGMERIKRICFLL